MRTALITCLLLLVRLAVGAESNVPPREYARAALLKTGNVTNGKTLFLNEQRLACTRCHSFDGSASKAGPDLFAVGDKFGRREIIEAVLWPSTNIAVGYSTTAIETKSGDEFTGIIKQATDEFVEIITASAERVRINRREIASQHTSDTSLMPEGLQSGMTVQEFTDLVEFLVTLKQTESANLIAHGMPAEIPETRQPVELVPFPSAELKFEHPVWFGPVPGISNQFAVVEHESGRIWLLSEVNGLWTKSIFLDVGKFHRGTRGLLGMAFHPDFARNRRYFIARHIEQGGRFATLVIEYEAANDLRHDSGKSPRILLRFDETTNVHYGGGLAFGPDGFFYIGMGDSGPQEDPQGHGQNTKLFLGKLLRIDVDHRAGDEIYRVPEDNPFLGRPDFLPEIWAYGFREPWRFSFDPVTRDLWVGDVGQDRYEEVDIIRRGENYGWNVYEGFEPFSNRYRRTNEVFVAPVFAYARKYGPSVTGGFVYRGNPKSALYGVYIFGDYESKRIWGLTQEDRRLKKIYQIGRAPERIVSFGEDAQRDLYLVGYEGTIFKMDLSRATFE